MADTKEVVESIERYVNRLGIDYEEFSNELANLHPTLQQNVMRLFIAWCKEMAQKKFFDDRNKGSVLLARKIVDIADDYPLPFV